MPSSPLIELNLTSSTLAIELCGRGQLSQIHLLPKIQKLGKFSSNLKFPYRHFMLTFNTAALRSDMIIFGINLIFF